MKLKLKKEIIMKKEIALFLALAMGLALCGCSKQETTYVGITQNVENMPGHFFDENANSVIPDPTGYTDGIPTFFAGTYYFPQINQNYTTVKTWASDFASKYNGQRIHITQIGLFGPHYYGKDNTMYTSCNDWLFQMKDDSFTKILSEIIDADTTASNNVNFWTISGVVSNIIPNDLEFGKNDEFNFYLTDCDCDVVYKDGYYKDSIKDEPYDIDAHYVVSPEYETYLNTTTTPASNVILPEPDPETSDMPTFYPSSDDFPDINMGDLASDEWIKAFKDEYGNTQIRIAYLYLEGPIIINGSYYLYGVDWYFEISREDVEFIDEFNTTFGPDSYEYVIEGTVSTETISGRDGCRILLTDCSIDFAMGMPYWKDAEYSDNPDGDGYDGDYSYSYDNAVQVDARGVGKNTTRFMYNYQGQMIQLYNVRVYEVYNDYVYLICTGSGTEPSYYHCVFDDIATSGALDLNKDDYVNVWGVVSDTTLFGDIKMTQCVFVKGYGSGSSTIYGGLNDAFGSVMDDIYGSGWRGIYGY